MKKTLLLFVIFLSCSSLSIKELPPTPIRPTLSESEDSLSLKENIKTLFEYIYDLEDWIEVIKKKNR